MSTESFRDVLVGVSNRRNQNPDEFEDLSEKRKLVATAKISAEQKSSSLASPKSKSYPDALQDEGKALSEKRKLAAKAKTSAKYKSLSLASQGATSSSSAPAPPPSASAIDLQAEVSEEKVNPCDFANDLDPASHHHKKADTDATTVIDQESVDKALKTKSKPGGNTRKEEATLMKLGPVNLPDGGVIKPERLGSNSNVSEKFRQERPGNLKDVIKGDDLSGAFVIREVFSNYKKTEEGRSIDACIKEKLQKSRTAKNEKIDTMIHDMSFARMFALIYFIATNTNLKADFAGPKWPIMYRLPEFNSSADRDWWEQNFDPEIASKRLKIMEEAANEVKPDLKYYTLCQVNSEANRHAHPRADVEDVIKMAEQKEFVFGGDDLASAVVHCATVVERTGSN